MNTPPARPSQVSGTYPHPDRVWNYLMGGKDYLPCDRVFSDQVAQRFPAIWDQFGHLRAFWDRLPRVLVEQIGFRQLLVVGTGLPAGDPVHAVAQRADPHTRVVYTEHGAFARERARAALAGAAGRLCQLVRAGDTDVYAIVADAAQTLDLDQPVAVLLSRLDRLRSDDAARAVVNAFGSYLVPGSRVVVIHPTSMMPNSGVGELLAALRAQSTVAVRGRSLEQIAALRPQGATVQVAVPVSWWWPDGPGPHAYAWQWADFAVGSAQLNEDQRPYRGRSGRESA